MADNYGPHTLTTLKDYNMTIRTAYSYHALRANLGGYQPLTLRQFVALRASMAFGGAV